MINTIFENETLAQHISKQFKDPAYGGNLTCSSIYLDLCAKIALNGFFH